MDAKTLDNAPAETVDPAAASPVAAASKQYVGERLYDTFLKQGATIDVTKEEFNNKITIATGGEGPVVYKIEGALEHVSRPDLLTTEEFSKQYVKEILSNPEPAPGKRHASVLEEGVLTISDKMHFTNILKRMATTAESSRATLWDSSSSEDIGVSMARGLLTGQLNEVIRDSEKILDKMLALKWMTTLPKGSADSVEAAAAYIDDESCVALAIDFRHEAIARHACHKIGLEFLKNLWSSDLFKYLPPTHIADLMSIVRATFGILTDVAQIDGAAKKNAAVLSDKQAGMLASGVWKNAQHASPISVNASGIKFAPAVEQHLPTLNKKVVQTHSSRPPKTPGITKTQKKIGMELALAPTQAILQVEQGIANLIEKMITEGESGHLGKIVHLGAFEDKKNAQTAGRKFIQNSPNKHYELLYLSRNETAEIYPASEVSIKHVGADLPMLSPNYQRVISRFMARALFLDNKYAELGKHLEITILYKILLDDLKEFQVICVTFEKHMPAIQCEAPRAMARINNFLALLKNTPGGLYTKCIELASLMTDGDLNAPLLTKIMEILSWPAPFFATSDGLFKHVDDLAAARVATTLTAYIESPWLDELKTSAFINHRRAYDIMYAGLMSLRLAAASHEWSHIIDHDAARGSPFEIPTRKLLDFWTGLGASTALGKRLAANLAEYHAIKRAFVEKTGRAFYEVAAEDYKTAARTALQCDTLNGPTNITSGKVLFEVLATKFYNPIVSRDALLTKIDKQAFVPFFTNVFPTLALEAQNLVYNPSNTTTLDGLILSVAAHCRKEFLNKDLSENEIVDDTEAALRLYLAYTMSSYLIHGVAHLNKIVEAAPKIEPFDPATTEEVGEIITLHRTISQLVVSFGLSNKICRNAVLSQFSQALSSMVVGIGAGIRRDETVIEKWIKAVLGFCLTNASASPEKVIIKPTAANII